MLDLSTVGPLPSTGQFAVHQRVGDGRRLRGTAVKGQLGIRTNEDPELAPIAAWLRSGGSGEVCEVLRGGEPGSWPPHIEAAYRYFGDFHFCVILRANHDEPLAGDRPIKGRIDLTEEDLFAIRQGLENLVTTAGPPERPCWSIRVDQAQVVVYVEDARPLG